MDHSATTKGEFQLGKQEGRKNRVNSIPAFLIVLVSSDFESEGNGSVLVSRLSYFRVFVIRILDLHKMKSVRLVKVLAVRGTDDTEGKKYLSGFSHSCHRYYPWLYSVFCNPRCA